LRDDSGPAQPKTTRVEVDDDQFVAPILYFMTSPDNLTYRTNTRNDAILHRLIHTKLLSGSLNPGLDLTPAQRRMALAGRVLELSGSARLGKGEKQVRIVERNKAAKRVREGILEKQKQREMAQLDEVRTVSNFGSNGSEFDNRRPKTWVTITPQSRKCSQEARIQNRQRKEENGG
jgi:hypothetical protein